MEVTAKLRSHFYNDFLRDFLPHSTSCPTTENGPQRMEGTNNGAESNKSFPSEPHTAVSQNLRITIAGQPSKGAEYASGMMSKLNENEQREDCASSHREDTPTSLNSSRMQLPLVTRSILEVVIPEYAVIRLLAKSKNKLAQISEALYMTCFFIFKSNIIYLMILKEQHPLEQRKGLMWVKYFNFTLLKSMDEDVAEAADDGDQQRQAWLWPLTGKVHWKGIYDREREQRYRIKMDKKCKIKEKLFERMKYGYKQKSLGR